jgi:phage shock protein PspC (stress-responsive transcriptional regulator)
MLAFGFSEAFSQTFALLVTFVGIGVIVNVLIIYIVAQIIGEHKQNRERREQ